MDTALQTVSFLQELPARSAYHGQSHRNFVAGGFSTPFVGRMDVVRCWHSVSAAVGSRTGVTCSWSALRVNQKLRSFEGSLKIKIQHLPLQWSKLSNPQVQVLTLMEYNGHNDSDEIIYCVSPSSRCHVSVLCTDCLHQHQHQGGPRCSYLIREA